MLLLLTLARNTSNVLYLATETYTDLYSHHQKMSLSLLTFQLHLLAELLTSL